MLYAQIRGPVRLTLQESQRADPQGWTVVVRPKGKLFQVIPVEVETGDSVADTAPVVPAAEVQQAIQHEIKFLKGLDYDVRMAARRRAAAAQLEREWGKVVAMSRPREFNRVLGAVIGSVFKDSHNPLIRLTIVPQKKIASPDGAYSAIDAEISHHVLVFYRNTIQHLPGDWSIDATWGVSILIKGVVPIETKQISRRLIIDGLRKVARSINVDFSLCGGSDCDF